MPPGTGELAGATAEPGGTRGVWDCTALSGKRIVTTLQAVWEHMTLFLRMAGAGLASPAPDTRGHQVLVFGLGQAALPWWGRGEKPGQPPMHPGKRLSSEDQRR